MKITSTVKTISATALASAISIPALGDTSIPIELKIRERTDSRRRTDQPPDCATGHDGVKPLSFSQEVAIVRSHEKGSGIV